jgi:cation:H+ antiporter
MVYPLAYPGGSIRRDSAIMLLASLVFTGLCLADGLNRSTGVMLLVALAAVAIPTLKDATKAHYETEGHAPMEVVLGLPAHRRVIFLFIIAGLIGLPVGARMVVQSAVEIATVAGLSEAVVGLTIIAFSTSLPELATTIVAAYRKDTDVAVGTLVGSNIFNILAIMGTAATVAPHKIAVPPLFPFLDLPVMVAAAVIITGFVWKRRPVGRGAGILLTAGYVTYVAALLVFS